MTKRSKPEPTSDKFEFHSIKQPGRPPLGRYAPIDKQHMRIHKSKRSKYGNMTKTDFLEKGNR